MHLMHADGGCRGRWSFSGALHEKWARRRRLQVSDNSGAKIVQCIQKSGTQWTIGDIITVAVKKARGGKVSLGCTCTSNRSRL